MASVSLRQVRKTYGEVEIVKGLDLEVAQGEFLVLLGESGCGKSTTLRMLAGLEEQSSGDIFIGDRCVNSVDAKDRNLAMVFQSYALYPHMTVYENIAFALQLKGMDKASIDRQVRWAAEMLRLQPLLDRKPKALSGGQRQRVAMGRAMVRTPEVFLFDEPLSNLDAKLRNQMRAEIKQLHRQLGTTTLYVTHDQVEAMTLADRVVIMERGQIAQIGTPYEVFHRPANLFVAQFIGSPAINVFDAQISRDSTGWWLNHAKMRLPLPERFHSKAEPGQQVKVGIRPTDISTRPLTESKQSYIQPLLLEDKELLGASLNLSLSLDDVKLCMEAPSDGYYPLGEVLECYFNLDALQVFDVQSGLSLASYS